MAQWGIKALMDKDDDTRFLPQDPLEGRRKLTVKCCPLNSRCMCPGIPTHPPEQIKLAT